MSDNESVSTLASEDTTKEQDEDDWKKMENIRVVCRFRPINTREMVEEKNNDMRDSPPVIEYGKVIKLGRSDYMHAGPMEFVMDRVFENNTTQNQVFVKVGKPMVMACLEGYNSTIFAYGQTGSGKTFTMFGPEKITNPELLGIVQRSVSFMFEDLKRRKDSKEVKEYQVLAEFIQLYREQINDLLEPDTPVPLKIRLDIATDSPYIPNLRQVDVSNTADVVRLLTVAQNNRVVDKTLMNAVSSRSHMVMTIRVIQTMKDGSVKKSKLNFVESDFFCILNFCYYFFCWFFAVAMFVHPTGHFCPSCSLFTKTSVCSFFLLFYLFSVLLVGCGSVLSFFSMYTYKLESKMKQI